VSISSFPNSHCRLNFFTAPEKAPSSLQSTVSVIKMLPVRVLDLLFWCIWCLRYLWLWGLILE
jgi:hypothetical protein